jgi:DNA-binding protein HU-beta
MNKEELVKAIADESGQTNAEVKKFLESYIKVTVEALSQGETIQLIGFFTLSVNERAARKGRNPKTGEEISIAASKAVKFVAGKQLKESVNKSKAKPKAKATAKK